MRNCFALTAASVILLASETTIAASISDIERFQKDDGALNLYLRSVQINVKSKNDLIENDFGGFPDGSRLGGHAVGAILDYNSPYLADSVGIDASYYAVGEVAAEDNSMGLLQDEKKRSFVKLGQAYLKGRYRSDNYTISGQFGRGRFESATVSTRDTRVAPDSYFGGRVALSVTGPAVFGLDTSLKLDGVRITQSSLRNNGGFDFIRSESNQRIKNVTSVGAEFDMKVLKVMYGAGIASEFNKNQVLKISLKAPLPNDGGVILNYQHHKLSGFGDIWEKDFLSGASAYESEANFRNINIGYVNGGFRAGISLAKTRAKSGRTTPFGTEVVGYAYLDHGSNVIGNYDAWTLIGNDFNNDGEVTRQIAFEYDMNKTNLTSNPLDGVVFGIIHKIGKFDATDPMPLFLGGDPAIRNVMERQTEYHIYYRFDEKDYSGISAGMAYTNYNINKDFVALVAAQNSNVVTGDELRIYVDYAF